MVRRARPPLIALSCVLVLSAAVYAWSSPSAGSQPAPVDGAAAAAVAAGAGPQEGQQIWSRDCAVCHGVRGGGSFQGPAIDQAGTAAVDFMVRTGRMPSPYRADSDLFGPTPPPQRDRSTPQYSEPQIEALVAYTAGFVSGPAAVPSVDTSRADLGAGGEAYRLQCSACHQMAGSGGALAYGAVGPALDQATPREVVEAMRTGPGNMPIFDRSVLSDEQAVDVAAYVEYLKDPQDRGGLSLWHLGPVPEGLVAWLVGIGGVVLFCRWLGERQRVKTR